MYRAYWNMEYNPFSKEIGIDKMYKTEDFNEAITRLEFLEKTRGFGLFTGFPGTGKTYTIKYFLENFLLHLLHLKELYNQIFVLILLLH